MGILFPDKLAAVAYTKSTIGSRKTPTVALVQASTACTTITINKQASTNFYICAFYKYLLKLLTPRVLFEAAYYIEISFEYVFVLFYGQMHNHIIKSKFLSPSFR